MSRRDRGAWAWLGRGMVGVAAAAWAAGLAAGAQAAPIGMPAGSTVWMHFGAAVCPDADGDDCVGSNLPGVAPPNGIPLTTFTDGTSTAAVYAEVLPDRVRTYTSTSSTSVLRVSFEDTYTVHGSTAGSFPVTVTLSASGIANSVTNRFGQHILIGAGVQLEIGVFDHNPVAMNEQFRVTSFGGPATSLWSFTSPAQAAPFSAPISVSATYTLNVGVGDVFDLAYGVNPSLGAGGVDLLANGAVISFDLPEGVWLTSELGGTWGVVPEPSTFALTALGVGAFAARGRGRRG